MRRNLLITLLGACLFLVVLFLLIMWIITPKYARSVEAHIEVADYVGINVDNDKLYFGANSPGGGARRQLIITSDEDVFVLIKREGDIADWMTVSEDNIVVNAREERQLNIHLLIPKGTADGNYTGAVIAEFYRPAARLFLS